LFALFCLTTFVAPGFYFGWVETGFSPKTIKDFQLSGALAHLIILGGLEIKSKWKLGNILPEVSSLDGVAKSVEGQKVSRVTQKLIAWYMFAVTATILFWVLCNFEALPAYGWFSGRFIPRPDGVATVQHFYSFSTILYFVLPAFVFYLRDKVSGRVFTLLLFIMGVGLGVGGHRGVLAFYLIFIWWFLWQKVISWKMLLGVAFAFLANTINTLVTRGELLSLPDNLRKGSLRFLVEQARGIPARIEMVNTGVVFEQGVSIKRQVAQYFWPSSTGTMPTAWFADLFVQFGWIGALAGFFMVVVSILAIIYFAGMFADTLYFKWAIMSLLFLLFSAEITAYSSIRMLVILGNFLVLTGCWANWKKQTG